MHTPEVKNDEVPKTPLPLMILSQSPDPSIKIPNFEPLKAHLWSGSKKMLNPADNSCIVGSYFQNSLHLDAAKV